MQEVVNISINFRIYTLIKSEINGIKLHVIVLTTLIITAVVNK